MHTTKDEVIRHLCQTVGMAFHAIGDYSEPSDCFCCDNDGTFGFQHSGKLLEYVREAVKAKLIADGHIVRVPISEDHEDD
jgi:hypothetical protein